MAAKNGKALAARAANPYPHVLLPDGTEVTAWPDGVVGISRAPLVGQLLTPRGALQLGHALIAMSVVAYRSAKSGKKAVHHAR